ncbi:MAG: membrane protein insertase YidC [Candidatus Delongbacteria bacterium]
MDKNTKLAFLLIALIIIFYPYFLPEEKEVQTSKPGEDTFQDARKEASEVIDPKEDRPEIKHQAEKTVPDTALFVAETKDINIETDLYKAVLSTKNGAFKSWKIKKYKSRVDTSKLVELIQEGTSNLHTEISLKNSIVLENTVYETDEENVFLTGEGKTKNIMLTCKDSLGKTLYTKKFRFYSDKYSFDLSIDTSPIFDKLADDKAVAVKWPNGIKFTEVSDSGKNMNREDYYRETYVKRGEELIDFDDNDESISVEGEIEWGATRSKYFEVFFVSEEESFSAFMNYPAHDEVDSHYTSMGFMTVFDKGSTEVKDMFVYLGPMDYEIFKSYDKEFELTMNWGWDIIKPFSLAIYWTLKFLHNYIDNYGLVIIILSLIVNTLVLPFTLKSFKSQAAMKKVQPEMKLIKEKYKNDLQKQQQATMELYKKHNVNPLGTCIPTLLPMPILYGMFIVFGATIEFRGAEFVLWINDLSLPEIMFTLPFSVRKWPSGRPTSVMLNRRTGLHWQGTDN